MESASTEQKKAGWTAGRRLFVAALLALVAACPLYLVGFKLGWIQVRPWLFAALVAALGAGLVAELVLTVVRVVARRTPALTAGAKGLLLVGGALICAGGSVNWLLSLEGYMVLSEGDAVPLFGSRHLQAFTAGPFGDPRELHLMLRVLRVKLRPGPGGAPQAETTLRVERPGHPVRKVRITGSGNTAVGVLRVHGGVFGFSPRIVITKETKTVFDKVVPFTTRLRGRGPGGLLFSGAFTFEQHQLAIDGTLSLESLNRQMRGHPRLKLRVQRAGKLLGAGELRPGFFATMKDGYRVGFVGLRKWVELDISRRTYTEVVLAGAALAALGGVLWPLVAWLGRRRRRKL